MKLQLVQAIDKSLSAIDTAGNIILAHKQINAIPADQHELLFPAICVNQKLTVRTMYLKINAQRVRLNYQDCHGATA
ncbi:hypothetical protein C6380_14355 [Pseudomonas syringae pv. actinidiae]|nr:hypothetical protein BUE61_22560 [Pseudomonas syringae pv. actinidiae]PBK54238.1 hypothetical protein BUE60_10365 [Pseudomonas syringae pv. actinidiae]RJX53478.1 hypothetical protein C6379_17500 [Pseudomonas syringae pv. actinidiae]RJX55596.1 hypothetical protein C6380_14355 [Pseudomonas syringae pv. actinidiae]RJX63846.1 hypothetical protein C6383_05030 [Pseudomonas syringae pv. actinidiae]